jgi:hypothetical protein
MELLANGGFVDRRPRDDGPGYEICPLPPPELRPKRRIAAPADPPAQMPLGANFYPRTVDHVESITAEAAQTPENAAQVVALVDDRIFYDQTCSGGRQSAHAQNPKPDRPPEPNAPPSPPRGNDLPLAPPAEFAGRFLPHQWRRLCMVAPAGYDLAALAGDVLKLKTRTDAKWPWKLLCAALERGEPIYTQAEIEAQDAELRALTTPQPPDEATKKQTAVYKKRRIDEPYDASKTDWAALNRAQDAKRARAPAADEPSAAELLADLDEALAEEAAEIPPPAPVAPPPPARDLAALIAEAVALLADAPPDTLERGMLTHQITRDHRSPAEAAAAVRTRRERAARPTSRSPARRLIGGS